MKRHLPTVLGILVFLAATTARAQECHCDDVHAMELRLKEVNAAIKGFTRELAAMNEQVLRTQQPIMYTEERQAKLRGKVLDVINGEMKGETAAPRPSGTNPGETSNLCQVEINLNPSVSACIRESITRHEQYHREQCLKTRSAGAILKGVTEAGQANRFVRDHFSLQQYATEEIMGYTKEIEFLSPELARLRRDCHAPPPPPQKRDYTGQPRKS
jgi:hypothetical protein